MADRSNAIPAKTRSDTTANLDRAIDWTTHPLMVPIRKRGASFSTPRIAARTDGTRAVGTPLVRIASLNPVGVKGSCRTER